MLSYQHIYHAGNAADVHKHNILSMILSVMTQKDKPLSYMETHAGRGIYDLNSLEALKTGEAVLGIQKQGALLEKDLPYTKCLEAIRQQYGSSFYPGSPLLAQMLLRPFDHIHLMELHPQEYAALKKNMRFPNVYVHRRDGYEGVLALSPPIPRRGLVFIDPSYEVKEEYGQVTKFITALHKRWPEAIILLWYPILKACLHENMIHDLENIFDFWKEERLFKTPYTHLIGSGMICINRPYGVPEGL
jgi:23S rRNA (adenine2030-N6)-methyltransferase